MVSEALEARLDYISSKQLLSHYIDPLVGVRRCYPRMLAPQASGRLSVSDPPLINFPDKISDVVIPDIDHTWLCFDWEAIEARILAHLCHDTVDQEAFDKGWDIHTVTLARMFGYPACPAGWAKNEIFDTPVGREWCAQIQIGRASCRERV